MYGLIEEINQYCLETFQFEEVQDYVKLCVSVCVPLPIWQPYNVIWCIRQTAGYGVGMGSHDLRGSLKVKRDHVPPCPRCVCVHHTMYVLVNIVIVCIVHLCTCWVLT